VTIAVDKSFIKRITYMMITAYQVTIMSTDWHLAPPPAQLRSYWGRGYIKLYM